MRRRTFLTGPMALFGLGGSSIVVSATERTSIGLSFNISDYDFGDIEIGKSRTIKMIGNLDLKGNILMAWEGGAMRGGNQDIVGDSLWALPPFCDDTRCTTTITFSPQSLGSSTLIFFAGVSFFPCPLCDAELVSTTINFRGNGVAAVRDPAALQLFALGIGEATSSVKC